MNFQQNKIPRIVIKLASRCNINCDYCYWFRDSAVYNKPKLLQPEAEKIFLYKLSNYLTKFSLKSFLVIFHGGEPMLFGKKRFVKFCENLKNIELQTGCIINFAITTNGLLIDNEWCNIFKKFEVSITMSLDGNKKTNDIHRKDFKGNSTFDQVIDSLGLLRARKIEPTILAVCIPSIDPILLLEEFIEKNNIQFFDVLIPDKTHHDNVESIYSYYCKLFDYWYDHYSKKGIKIRIFDSIIQTLCGLPPVIDDLGYGPVTVVTLQTDGTLEANDTLRIIENGYTTSKINIFDHEIYDIQNDPTWINAYNSSLNLAEQCQTCKFKYTCGGGSLQSRWNKTNGYNNPSVYCHDIMKILDHIENKIGQSIYVNNL